MSRVEIKIDVTDWHEQAIKANVNPQNDEELAELSSNFNSRDIAKMVIGAREVGRVPDAIIKENKWLLLSGAAANVSDIIRRQREPVTAPNGEVISNNKYIGNPDNYKRFERKEESEDAAEQVKRHLDDKKSKVEVEPQDEPENEPEERLSYFPVRSPKGQKVVCKYLRKRIPNHIYNRLRDIALAGGDFEQEADLLIQRIEILKIKVRKKVIESN